MLGKRTMRTKTRHEIDPSTYMQINGPKINMLHINLKIRSINNYHCAAEAVFCYTAENSHHLEAKVTSKNLQFQEEKISTIKRARCHISMEKSSKNLISLFGGNAR
jgi:hypothetical protein